MKFGVFLEMQLPKPWQAGDEERLIAEALEQVVLADALGIDHAWAVEHHFLEEYSHCSASDVFLAAAAVRTTNIRLGFGIRHIIANYNHPARTAETVGMLDLISHGRIELGFGEGATRLELGGFGIPWKEKRAMSLEAAEQIANMMVMEPYPGYEGKSFSMPCRNVVPKPAQKPHPPMWMACTNRDTIRTAAANGLGALCFNFMDQAEAQTWSRIYYDTIRSEQCIPIGHTVNPNLAIVTAFGLHKNRDEAVRRNLESFEFFNYALGVVSSKDTRPGRMNMWSDFQAQRESEAGLKKATWAAGLGGDEKVERCYTNAPGIGTPEEFRRFARTMADSGIDQMIFIQQGGRIKHDHICESLELFGLDVLPDFRVHEQEREERKMKALAPYIEAALERKHALATLRGGEATAPATKTQWTNTESAVA